MPIDKVCFINELDQSSRSSNEGNTLSAYLNNCKESGITQLVTHFMSRGKDAIVAKINVGRSPEKITEMMPK